ncbi:MAG: host attachment protein [Nitrosospira sp.]|nr:host attachment protein [Nitrosospira sp.]
MGTTWILIADSSRARIFEKKGREKNLQEIEDFVNPAGRAASNELRTDERGRFYGRGEQYHGHTADPSVFPVEHENEMFSHTVTKYLDDARKTQRYEHLYLIAAPKFLGLIRGNLGEEVKKMVEGELHKDISTLKSREIEAYVNEEIDFL